MKKKLSFFYRKLSKKQQYWLDFLFTMTKKEIKVRYKRAKIGILWAFINPLLQMLIMGFVFQFFIPVKVDNYFIFLFAGLLPWNFFTETVLRATHVFVSERALIAKSRFPKETLVLSIVLANLFHTLIALSLLILVLLIFNWQGFLLLGLLKFLFFTPFLLLYLMIFVTAFSFFSATLNIKSRDTGFIVKVLLSLWFYATPIVYTLDLIPTQFQFLFRLNPMTGITEAFRTVLLGSELSSLGWMIGVFFIVFIFFWLSILFFRKNEAYFDDYL